MAKVNVCVQIYLQADSEEEGRKRSQEVEEQLRRFAPIESCEKKPYWKIPDYYGLFTVFAPVTEPEQLYLTILQLAEHGWSSYFDYTDPLAHSVWNSGRGSRLLSDSVKWASVDYMRVADNPRFSIEQQVRVVEDSAHPKMKEVRGLIGSIVALPSSDEKPSYLVSFLGDRGVCVWQIPEEDLEAVDRSAESIAG